MSKGFVPVSTKENLDFQSKREFVIGLSFYLDWKPEHLDIPRILEFSSVSWKSMCCLQNDDFLDLPTVIPVTRNCDDQIICHHIPHVFEFANVSGIEREWSNSSSLSYRS